MTRFRLEDLPPRMRDQAKLQLGAGKTPGQLKSARARRWADEQTAELVRQLVERGAPTPEGELRFSSTRRWRFDLGFRLPRLVGVEIEGGVHPGGIGHTDPKRFKSDIEKYNEAAILGWRVIRVTHAMVKDGSAATVILRALQQ